MNDIYVMLPFKGERYLSSAVETVEHLKALDGWDPCFFYIVEQDGDLARPLIEEHGGHWYRFNTDDVLNIPRALNIAVREAPSDGLGLGTCTDFRYAKNYLVRLREIWASTNYQQHIIIGPTQRTENGKVYTTRHENHVFPGAITTASIFDINGHDEEMPGWGPGDLDTELRVLLSGKGSILVDNSLQVEQVPHEGYGDDLNWKKKYLTQNDQRWREHELYKQWRLDQPNWGRFDEEYHNLCKDRK